MLLEPFTDIRNDRFQLPCFVWISKFLEGDKNRSSMSWSQRLNAWLGWCHKGLSSRYMCFGMKSGAVFNFFTKHHCHDQLHLSTQCWGLCITSYSYDCEVPGKYYRAGFPKITYFRICHEQYSTSTDIDYFQHIVEVAKSFLVQNWRKKNLHYW